METKDSATLEEELYLKKKSWWKRPFPWIAVVIIAAGGGAYAVVRQHTTASASPAYQIRWIQASTGTVSQSVSFSGTLQPTNQATVSASGTLKSISVKVGQKVKKGQVLAHLDTSSLELQLEQARAQLSSADAKLAQAKEPTTTTVKGQTQTTQPDPNVVQQAQASVDQAYANVVSLEKQIAACTIKSPIAGTIMTVADLNSASSTSTSSGSGSSAGSGSGSGSSNTIATITDLSSSHFEVQASVAQADVSQVHPGQEAKISLSSNGGAVLTGKVKSVQLIPQTSSGVTTYPAVIQVNKPTQSGITMLPGASVSVQVTEKQVKDVVTVPTAALTQSRGQIGVYEKASTSSGTSANSTSKTQAAQGISSSNNNGNSNNGNNGGTGRTSSKTQSAGSQSKSASGSSTVPAGLVFHPVTVGLYGGNTVQIKSGLKAGDQIALVLPTASQSSSSSSNGGSSSNAFRGIGRLSGGGSFDRGGNRGSTSGNGGSSSRSGGGN